MCRDRPDQTVDAELGVRTRCDIAILSTVYVYDVLLWTVQDTYQVSCHVMKQAQSHMNMKCPPLHGHDSALLSLVSQQGVRGHS
jgi:hypothetical protein